MLSRLTREENALLNVPEVQRRLITQQEQPNSVTPVYIYVCYVCQNIQQHVHTFSSAYQHVSTIRHRNRGAFRAFVCDVK